VAARSEAKAHAAIEKIYVNNKSVEAGKLIFLPLDLADLDSVVKAAEIFLKQETKLDILGESDTHGLEHCWLKEV
jgi:NAD(P)-dependent dehydrogenase (short-subunit alcohol dehydrogenase family)